MFISTSPRGRPHSRAVSRNFVIRADRAGGTAVRWPTGRDEGRASEFTGFIAGAGRDNVLDNPTALLGASIASRGFFSGMGYERGSIGRCIAKSFDSSPSRIYRLLNLNLSFPKSRVVIRRVHLRRYPTEVGSDPRG